MLLIMTSMKVMTRWWSGVFVVALLAVTSSCGGADSSSPTAPTSAPTSQTVPNLTGTWTGTTFSTGTGTVASAGITFFQTGSALSGTWYAGTTGGTLSGTINSSGGVSFTTTPSNPLTCPLSVTAVVANNVISGTWATTGCTEAITGTLSLTKGGGLTVGRIIEFVPLTDCCSITASVQGVGHTPLVPYFKLKNSGNASLTWTSILLNGVTPDAVGCTYTAGVDNRVNIDPGVSWCVYRVDGNTPNGGIIHPGETSTDPFAVRFYPNVVGTHYLTLKVVSDATGGTDTLQITGTATP
jgi:hypothetical protein